MIPWAITCSQHLVSTETRNEKQETKTDYTFSDGKIAKSLSLNQQKTKQNLNKCSTIFPCLWACIERAKKPLEKTPLE